MNSHTHTTKQENRNKKIQWILSIRAKQIYKLSGSFFTACLLDFGFLGGKTRQKGERTKTFFYWFVETLESTETRIAFRLERLSVD